MAAKFKYCLIGGELVIKDLKAQAGTYFEGEILAPATVGTSDEASVKTADGVESGSIVGVSNQGETLPAQALLQTPGNAVENDGATLTGTETLGTVENLKVIVNPDAVYGVDYDLTGTIACTAAVDGLIDLASGGTGFIDADTSAGMWVWDLTTGELNWVISTLEAAGTTDVEVVAGNSTGTAGRVFLYPSQCGLSIPIPINSDGLTIDADRQNVAVTGGGSGDGLNGIILENRLESMTHGSEILDPIVHNNQVRFPNTLLTEQDRTKAVAYVNFSSVFNQ